MYRLVVGFVVALLGATFALPPNEDGMFITPHSLSKENAKFMKRYASLKDSLSQAKPTQINGAKLQPIVFVPGLGGSVLEAKLTGTKNPPHWYCWRNADWYWIWINLLEVIPGVVDCWMHNLMVTFDPTTGALGSQEGVHMRPRDFGGVAGVDHIANIMGKKTTYLGMMIDYFKSKGYTPGVNFRASTYDWRFGPKDFLRNGQMKSLQVLIEETFAMNNNTKVHVLGHSLGAPYLQTFLATFVSDEWKDKYIASFIPIGGAFSGSISSLPPWISGTTYGLPIKQDKMVPLVRSTGSAMWMWPVARSEKDVKVIIGINGRNYTNTVEDYRKLLQVVTAKSSSEEQRRYESMLESISTVDTTKAPGVRTYCTYGVSIPTVSYSVYTNNNFTAPSSWDIGDGDGTVDIESLSVCDAWANDPVQRGKPVSVHHFKGVTHVGIVYVPEFWDLILSITTSTP